MTEMEALLELMRALRDPEQGCPWDREQDFSSIAPFTVEEAYEVADAIHRQHPEDLCEELGDLLFQVVFHAQLATEQGWFNFGDVVSGIVSKMKRRHPHVFGDESIATSADQSIAWEAHKARERENKAQTGETKGLLADLPRNLPPVQLAAKMQKKAAQVGFDWPDGKAVLAKIREELEELELELGEGAGNERIAEEMGDLLFSCINLCRHYGIEGDTSLRHTNRKFERRFQHMEEHTAANGRRLEDCTLEELEAMWSAAKQACS